jgi:hypothetical protein
MRLVMKGSPVRVRASALGSCLHSGTFGAALAVRVVYACHGYVPNACTKSGPSQAPGHRSAAGRRAAERPHRLRHSDSAEADRLLERDLPPCAQGVGHHLRPVGDGERPYLRQASISRSARRRRYARRHCRRERPGRRDPHDRRLGQAASCRRPRPGRCDRFRSRHRSFTRSHDCRRHAGRAGLAGHRRQLPRSLGAPAPLTEGAGRRWSAAAVLPRPPSHVATTLIGRTTHHATTTRSWSGRHLRPTDCVGSVGQDRTLEVQPSRPKRDAALRHRRG